MSKINELTMFEVAQAERAAGMAFMAAFSPDPNVPRAGILGALAWVHAKREEPKLTYDAFMKRVTSREVNDYLFEDGDDLDEEAGEGAGETFLAADAGGTEDRAGGTDGDVLPGDGDPAE